MFKKLKRVRRRERIWQILKEQNPELTKERFDGAYNSINNMLKIKAEIEKKSS